MRCPFRDVRWGEYVHKTEFEPCYKEDCMAYDKTIFPPCHRLRGDRADCPSPKKDNVLVEGSK